MRDDELDSVNASCQQAMRTGHELAYRLTRSAAPEGNERAFATQMLQACPWISAQNIERLFKQSVYCAWKTGGPPR